MGLAEDVIKYAQDPAALVAEVARLTALKAEVDARLGAEVDVITAREQLDNANKTLAKAERKLEVAIESGEKIIISAQKDAADIRAAAQNDAAEMRVAATRDAEAMKAQAASELASARAAQADVNEKIWNADRASADASAASAEAAKSKARYDTLADEAAALTRRLKDAQDSITAALGA